MNFKPHHLAIPLVIGVLVAGCNSSNTQTIDDELASLISAAGLKGDPIESQGGVVGAPAIPAITGNADAALQAKVDLGKLLFFSKEMSGSRDVACVTCHHPVMGGGDNVAIPIGASPTDVDIFGPGRTRSAAATVPPYTTNGIAGNPAMPRNSPTVFGLGFWDKSITWDGTVFSEKGTKGLAGTDSRILAPIDLRPVSYDPVLANVVATRFDLLGLSTVNYTDKFDTGMLISAGHGMFPASVKPAMRGANFADGSCVAGNVNVTAADNVTVIGTVSVSCTGASNTNYSDMDIRKIIAMRFNTATWAPLFTAAFGDSTATANRVSTAIATYERSMTFTQSPWRAYVKGDKSAITDAQKRGAKLFFTSIAKGGAGCSTCHAGDFFTDEENYVLAVPQIGRGKADTNPGGDNNDDWGRAHVTGLDSDKYAYRVPTLLNAEVTGPWGHTGVFKTLEAAIRHHLNAEASVTSFKASVDAGTLQTQLQTDYGTPIDFTRAKEHTDYALARLKAQRAAGMDVLQDVTLTNDQVADLVAFMNALTDPCTKDNTCLAKWVPQTTEYTQPQAAAFNLICPKDKLGANLINTQRCQ